jgi:hypothetical protein
MCRDRRWTTALELLNYVLSAAKTNLNQASILLEAASQ